MTEALTVLVDMDGVLADFDEEILDRIEERYPHIPKLDVRRNFYVAEDFPEHSQLVRELSNEEGFFASLPLAQAALEGWQRMIDLGYDPRVCSSPISANPHSEKEKLGWLRQHFVPVFGESVVERAVITKDKHLYDGIALIDDRPEVRNSVDAAWRHIVFDKPYNQHSAAPRLRGWLDDKLPSLLESATDEYVRRKAGK